MSTDNLQKNEASEIIDRLREALSVKSDAALARFFGSKSGTCVWNWRDKNEVPEGNIALVSVKTKYCFDWLRDGVPPKKWTPDHPKPVPVIHEEEATYGEMEKRLQIAWPVASDEAKESAVLILENSARRSPGKGAGDAGSTQKKYA